MRRYCLSVCVSTCTLYVQMPKVAARHTVTPCSGWRASEGAVIPMRLECATLPSPQSHCPVKPMPADAAAALPMVSCQG